MATVARTLKTVRPHIPLIKFPSRVKGPGASQPVVPSSNPAASVTPAAAASASKSKPIGSTPRGSGVEFLDLPRRYHRKLIDAEEMEYIEKGGPV